MIISYLMQTVLALLALGILGVYRWWKVYRSTREQTRGRAQNPNRRTISSRASLAKNRARRTRKGHFEFWLRILSEFHKAQCFYSIALQTASFVVIYGKKRNRLDDMFLLLISADGILPVAMALYTLSLFNHARTYDVVLGAISTLLASVTGFSIVLGYSSAPSSSGTDWPISCGGRSLEQICDGYSIDYKYAGSPNTFFAGGAIALDVLVGLLVFEFCFPRLKTLTHLRLPMYPRSIGNRAQKTAIVIRHVLITLILLACVAIEFYFVALGTDDIFVPSDWSFGQVVGITI